jgi:peptidoglycan/xylan/chitin deacetylase (PgdA/CDA1 family)/folate-dependent phosphoribosylglycinamide formyltransferase PurN
MDRPRFSVVLITGQPPDSIARLAERIARDVPGARITGVLQEQFNPKRLPQRIRTFARNLRDPAFVPYVAARIAGRFAALLRKSGHGILRVLHAAPEHPNDVPAVERIGLERWLAERGARLLRTRNPHTPESLQFVKDLEPDLGIVFGTRILKPELFEIPRLGSINIHKRKVPDYRGGGPIALWELLDDQSEIGVTVHRVAVKLDAGDIIRTASIPVEPYDTPESLGLKADVIGNDLLVQATADYATGNVSAVQQQGTGRMFRTPPAHQMRRLYRQLERRRPPHRYPSKRPAWKLWARILGLGPGAVLRNFRHRRHARFPVVILYHHVITDRPHSLGMSTTQFRRHVEYLKRHYRILSLEDAVAALRTGRIGVPTVVLTFDDGHADNWLNVRAVTEPLRVPVTFFVCSHHIETGEPFAHDIQAGDLGFAPMTWDQVRSLRAEGHTFGSHTRTHFNCGSTDRERLERELVDSRNELEHGLGEAVPFFSFPWGHPPQMSTPAVEIALANYERIFSACGGVNPPQASPRQHLLRCSHPANLLELELLLQSLLELDPPGAKLTF